MKIACLHTADSNIAVYERAALKLGLPPRSLRHHVRADLLFNAERAGGLTTDIGAETASALLTLADDADAVVLNCSTLGPSVALTKGKTDTPVLRADAALAESAVRTGGKVVVLCTTETTIAPTTQLFDAAARHTRAEIEVRLIAGAWALFRAGDLDGYFERIAEAADMAYREGAATVAFAQASMTNAAWRVKTDGRLPMTGPTIALQAAMTAVAP